MPCFDSPLAKEELKLQPMATASLQAIVNYSDRLLAVGEFPDYDAAFNGLQVENRGKVSRIAAAVDASIATARLAIDSGADLLIVHHGLFWSPRHPWTKQSYELLRLLTDNELAVYSVHLPLDAHPRLGNNAQLCRLLGLTQLKPFFPFKDREIGLRAEARVKRSDLARRLRSATGVEPKVIPGGPETCRRIGVVTGGAGSDLKNAAKAGLDTFVTGEGPHWTFALAEELGLNVLYGGHYATEIFGVKALAEHLSRRFNVPWTFIDHPTGL
jgi:dinuclear metal center YbgI/SA1388 family protein